MLSGDKVNVKLGCGGWVVPVTFIILLVAKVILHSNISWLVVFSPFLIGIGLIIILLIIWLILYYITDGRSNRHHK